MRRVNAVPALVFVFMILVPNAVRGAIAQGGSTESAAEAQKKYEQIVTPEAKSSPGVFTIHQVSGRYYFEIPAAAFGKDMLWYAEAAQVPVKVGMMGNAINSRVVRWEKRGDKVYVRDLSTRFKKRAQAPRRPTKGPTPEERLEPVELAVEEAALPPIMLDFKVEAQGPGDSVLIDVTDTFSSNIPEFSAKPMLILAGYEVKNEDPSRSYIAAAKAFPRNVEVSSMLTFPVETGETRSASILVRHSLTLLPEEPMMPRFFDPRVGYFTTDFEDYSGKEANRVLLRRLILRHRLEKKDPDADISEPVKPIVYYVGRGVPDKWRPYIKKGIEDWRGAFEAAGFRNAIIAEDAPTPEENPNWDASDTRYSVVRWQALPAANAMGPNVHDPRSGEIISAHILVWADVLYLAEKWYFAQCSAVDPRARHIPMPDELVGEMLRYIVSHEVGHTLGLRHNFRASQAFTVEQLRSPAFTSKYGDVASIMSYGRFNYVAQPGDGVTRLIPKIGPYDVFAIHWGYYPIPSAETPEQEVPTLDEWAAQQIDNPWLRFGGEDEAAYVDPSVLTENIGAERIEATRLGLKNLERTLGYLVSATTKLGGIFDVSQEMYGVLLDQRNYWLKSVIKEIGGVRETRTLAGRGGEQFHRVPRERQQESVRYVLEAGLRTPAAFLNPEILNLFSPLMSVQPVLDRQRALVDSFLKGSTYLQLLDESELDPDQAYPIFDYFTDLQNGLWDELRASSPSIGPVRRELQRHYIVRLTRQLAVFEQPVSPPEAEEAGLPTDFLAFLVSSGQGTDFRAAARAALEQLDGQLVAAAPKSADEITRIHLENCHNMIDDALKLSGRGEPSGQELGGEAAVPSPSSEAGPHPPRPAH